MATIQRSSLLPSRPTSISEWLAFHDALLNIRRRSVLISLFGLYSDGSTCAPMQPCASSQCHFVRTHTNALSARVFSCNLPLATLAEWPGSFTSYCGNTWVERIPKLKSAQKVDPVEENSPAAPAGTRTHDLSITSPADAIPLSCTCSPCMILWLLILTVSRSNNKMYTQALRWTHRIVNTVIVYAHLVLLHNFLHDWLEASASCTSHVVRDSTRATSLSTCTHCAN